MINEDIEVCANCQDLFDFSERYLLTPDGWVCSLDCYTGYFYGKDSKELEINSLK